MVLLELLISVLKILEDNKLTISLITLPSSSHRTAVYLRFPLVSSPEVSEVRQYESVPIMITWSLA